MLSILFKTEINIKDLGFLLFFFCSAFKTAQKFPGHFDPNSKGSKSERNTRVKQT